jgi:neutral trehalase
MKKLELRISLVICLLLIAVVANPATAAESVAPAKGVKSASPELLRLDQSQSAAEWDKGFLAVYQTLLKNLHLPNRNFKTRYAYPSPVFMGVYLWDSSFIAQVWKPWDYKTAEDVLLAVLDNAAPDGRLKHFVSPYDKSDLTQPPVIAWSVWQLYDWSGDKEFLAHAYPILKNYNDWLYKNRRLSNGLFFWKHSYESGIDNSPRFVTANEKPVLEVQKLAAIDLNSYVHQQNVLLAKMAEVLGKSNEAAAFKKNAEDLNKLINDRLWDEQTGLYFDRYMETDQLVKIKTIASLIPLFAGVPDAARAKRLREHAMNPREFNTWFPMPSVARDDKSFEKDCWRGPVWINTAYMPVKGLQNYGFDDDAAELAWKITDGVYKNYAVTGKLVEFYDPDHPGFQDLHRKRGNLYKQITLGGKPQPNFVGWTGLVNTLAIEDLIGFHKQGNKMTLAPRFPDAAKGASFKLTLPAESIVIEITVMDSGGTKGQVSVSGKTQEFSLQRGENTILSP